jgi:hypothetical protein
MPSKLENNMLLYATKIQLNFLGRQECARYTFFKSAFNDMPGVDPKELLY